MPALSEEIVTFCFIAFYNFYLNWEQYIYFNIYVPVLNKHVMFFNDWTLYKQQKCIFKSKLKQVEHFPSIS